MDERLRVPMASDYAFALGQATYCFARCEWMVVWCWERLEDNALHDATTGARGRGMTAGVIADRFKSAVERSVDVPECEELLRLANDFRRLVVLRNSLMHGKPHTSNEGWQGLYGSGHGSWSVADIEDAADQFTVCSMALNALHYGVLAQYHTARQLK